MHLTPIDDKKQKPKASANKAQKGTFFIWWKTMKTCSWHHKGTFWGVRSVLNDWGDGDTTVYIYSKHIELYAAMGAFYGM